MYVIIEQNAMSCNINKSKTSFMVQFVTRINYRIDCLLHLSMLNLMKIRPIGFVLRVRQINWGKKNLYCNFYSWLCLYDVLKKKTCHQSFCRKFVDHTFHHRWQMMVMVFRILFLEKTSSTSTYPANVPVQRLWVSHFKLQSECMVTLQISLTVCLHRTLTASAATLSRPCLTFLLSSIWIRRLSTDTFLFSHIKGVSFQWNALCGSRL